MIVFQGMSSTGISKQILQLLNSSKFNISVPIIAVKDQNLAVEIILVLMESFQTDWDLKSTVSASLCCICRQVKV